MNSKLRKSAAVCLGAAILVVVSPFCVSAQEQPSPTSSTGDNKQLVIIAGTVMRAGTGEPLRKAQVTLTRRDDKAPSIRVAVTGTDGKFAIKDITPGAYDLNVEHVGYVDKSYGEDTAGQGSAVLTLAAGQKITDLIFRLQKCSAISGHVTDEDGDPMQSVTVEAVRRTTYRRKVTVVPVGQSETNDLGEYRVFDLPPGRYYIRAKPTSPTRMDANDIDVSVGSGSKILNSYVETYYPDAADVSRAAVFELRAGDEIPSMDFSLIRNRTYKIRGQVIDTTSSNIPGFAINVMSSTDFEFDNVAQSMADKNNSFEISGLPPGSYLLMALGSDEGRVLKGIERVDITNGDVDSVKVVIKRGAEIHGRVVMEDNSKPPKVLMVSLMAKEGDLGMGGTGRVKTDGTFEVRDVLDGVYRVELRSDCEECYLKSAKMNGIDALDKGLQVAGGASGPLEVLVSSHSGMVDGVATKNDDLPAVGVEVILMPDLPNREPSGRYKSTTTDQYGRFTIRGVEPGRYKAFAFKKADDYVDFEDPEFIKPFESKGESVLVDENGKLTLKLKLIAADAGNPSE